MYLFVFTKLQCLPKLLLHAWVVSRKDGLALQSFDCQTTNHSVFCYGASLYRMFHLTTSSSNKQTDYPHWLRFLTPTHLLKDSKAFWYYYKRAFTTYLLFLQGVLHEVHECNITYYQYLKTGIQNESNLKHANTNNELLTSELIQNWFRIILIWIHWNVIQIESITISWMSSELKIKQNWLRNSSESVLNHLWNTSI